MSVSHSPDFKKKRKPHTRVSKACTFCRQQKTRCLRSNNSVSCLRCLSLDLNCSLIIDLDNNNKLNQCQSQCQPQPHNLSSNQNYSPLSNTPNFDNSNLLPSIPNFISNNNLFDRSNSNPVISNNNFINNSNQLLNQKPPFLNNNLLLNSNDMKLDIIQKNTNQILSLLSIISDNSLSNNQNNNQNLINSNNNNNNSNLNINNIDNLLSNNNDIGINDAMPLLSDPINLTNIPAQFNLLSPINHFKNITDDSNLENSNLVNLPLCIQQQLYPLHFFKPCYQDIITTNILTFDECIHLLDIFRDRYGRWLSFPSIKSTNKLLLRLRKRCPLLLTISCLLSLKYGDPILKLKIWDTLKNIVRKEVNWLYSSLSGSLEELQCLVILGAYSIGLSDNEFDLNNSNNSNSNNNNVNNIPILLLDGWQLSGIGLTFLDKFNNYGLLDQMYGIDNEILWKKNKKLLNLKFNNIFTNNSNNNINIVNDDLIDKNIINKEINGNSNVENNITGQQSQSQSQSQRQSQRQNQTQNNYHTNINNGDIENEDEDEDDDDDEIDTEEFNLLTLHRIWNTFILIHLAYCLLYGRKSWIDLNKLKPRNVSDISSATNFDFRIISEIHMYLIGYKHIILNEKINKTIDNIQNWLNKWNCTFSQPSNQFIEIDYHFIEILIKIKQLKINLNFVNLSNLNLNDKNLKDLNFIKLHCKSIINLINTVTDDSYYAFLSDQIHLTVFYSTNLLIKILSLLKNSPNNNLTNKVNTEIIKKIQNLILRYRNVSTTQYDPFYKYYQILQLNYSNNLLSPV